MAAKRTLGHPVLIIGAGRGGTALLEMFVEDSLVNVLAIADTNPSAPGIQLARNHGIPTYVDAIEALQACKDYTDCIVFNLSHDDAIAEEVEKVFNGKRIASGLEVKLFWQMVTNLKQVKTELEKSQAQLQSIIHNVMDGIITINESGEIQGFNPAAEQIFGYSHQEAMGRNLSMLMPEPDRSAHHHYIEHYVQTGQARILGVRGREVTAVRKNGERFPMELSASEMVLAGQRYFIGIVRDITERKRTEQKIAHLAHYDFSYGPRCQEGQGLISLYCDEMKQANVGAETRRAGRCVDDGSSSYPRIGYRRSSFRRGAASLLARGSCVAARPLKNHEDSPHRAWHRVTDQTTASMWCEPFLLMAWLQESAGFSTGGRQRASIAGGRPAVGNPCSLLGRVSGSAGRTRLAMSQTNPTNSRAMAAQVLF